MATAESTKGGSERAPRPDREQKFKALDREEIRKLVATNLPAQIISSTNLAARFGEDGEKFTPSLFQPIQTVRVRTADGDIVELIRDGHHRAKYLDDNYDSLIGTPERPGKHPDFKIVRQDATDEVLSMFGETHTGEGESTLTMAQYWLDVIPYTHAHSEVENKRTISHILTGWANHIGSALSEKYSAFAALCVLSDKRRFSVGRRIEIEDYLEEFFAEEPEREQLISGMLDAERILREARVGTTDALKEASLLVYAESENIGGERVGERQIAGLLALPAVRTKLHDPDSLVRGQLISAFTRSGIHITSFVDDYYTVLTDPDYSRDHIIDLLGSRNPIKTKQDIDKKIRTEKGQKDYRVHVEREELTGLEKALLRKQDVPFSVIQEANGVVATARSRLQDMPARAIRRTELQVCIDAIYKAPGVRVTSALIVLQEAIAKYNQAGPEQRATVQENVVPDQGEVIFLRKAASELQARLRRMTEERDAAHIEIATLKKQKAELQRLLTEAGIVYEIEPTNDSTNSDDPN